MKVRQFSNFLSFAYAVVFVYDFRMEQARQTLAHLLFTKIYKIHNEPAVPLVCTVGRQSRVIDKVYVYSGQGRKTCECRAK